MQDNLFEYNPHRHVKIWLSSIPDAFLNSENQMRLITLREINPQDEIFLIYDSSLLTKDSLKNLNAFTFEHDITPVDAQEFSKLLISDLEHRLYQSYLDEITHLKEGGNLAVASDILRWLSPAYRLGTYTDFDVPINTNHLSQTIRTQKPLLLNIGSLRSGGKDVILSNNDFIAVVDAHAANKDIECIQKNMIGLLDYYETDFIECTETDFRRGGALNKLFIPFMKDRPESFYIARSNSIAPKGIQMGSRALRAHIQGIMSSKDSFVQFHAQHIDESHQAIINRLRWESKKQLTLSKWLFYRTNYYELKNILKEDDDVVLHYFMKKERTLFLKSIVVCTTGPVAIARFLFNGYVFNTFDFDKRIRPYSFNHYGLKAAFQSKNSLGLHEKILKMALFLGAEDGTLNDSSWLEHGAELQKARERAMDANKQAFQNQLPYILKDLKSELEDLIKTLEARQDSVLGKCLNNTLETKIKALQDVLSCFKQDLFDTRQFKTIICELSKAKKSTYSRLCPNRTEKLINNLATHTHKAIVFGLSKNQMLKIA